MTLRIQTPRRPRKLKADGSPRKRPVDWEGNEQAVLIRWLLGEKMRGEPVGALHDVTYHVPNGGQRSKSTGAAMKRQGVKSGVSDLVVMDARGAGMECIWSSRHPLRIPQRWRRVSMIGWRRQKRAAIALYWP